MSSLNFVEGSSNSKRCAACKHLRRKCTEDCILAPYFSATNPQRFECIHKIFGAGNVARMLKMVAVHERGAAAESLWREAYWRVKDPVYGSAGVVMEMQQEICASRCELARILAQISIHQAHQAPQQQLLLSAQHETETMPAFMSQPKYPFNSFHDL